MAQRKNLLTKQLPPVDDVVACILAGESTEHWGKRRIESLPFNKRPRKTTKYQRARILKRDGSKCKECGKRKNLEIDHVIPIWKGGNNTDENKQVLCKKCNLAKNKEYRI